MVLIFLSSSRSGLKLFGRIEFNTKSNSFNLPLQTSDELLLFKERKPLVGQTKQAQLMPDCCTYDQTYRRIIELLNRTSGELELDLELSRAYVEELEVSWSLPLRLLLTISSYFERQRQ